MWFFPLTPVGTYPSAFGLYSSSDRFTTTTIQQLLYLPTPPTTPLPCATTERDRELTLAWHDRAIAAARPRLPPTSFTQASSPRIWWGKNGRFGTVFGETVHLAIGFVLENGHPIRDAARRAATRTTLASHLAAAVEDVANAIATLRALGITPQDGGFRRDSARTA